MAEDRAAAVVQKQRVRDTDMDVSTSAARRADDDVFNKRNICQAYPCDDADDCKILNCRGGCHPDENDRMRCYS